LLVRKDAFAIQQGTQMVLSIVGKTADLLSLLKDIVNLVALLL